MTNSYTTIGVLSVDYDRTEIVNVIDLRLELKLSSCCYAAKQYCDFRYSTNLQRFNYDPYTGDKIDWKKVKELLEL